MNMRKTLLLVGLVFAFSAFTASAETFVQSYYKNNPLSVSSLESDWGKPVSVKLYKDGLEKRIYGKKDSEVGYTYFLIKKGLVVDRGNTQSLNIEEPKKANGPELSGWMISYYKNNNRSAAEMMEKLGEPIHSTRYPNGMERIIFGPIEQDIYAYLIVKDGKVIDLGAARKPSIVKDKTTESPQISSFMSGWYKNHPENEKSLVDTWGKPVNVVMYKNGLKKMVFGPKDSVTGYNYFILKDGQVVDRGVTQSKS